MNGLYKCNSAKELKTDFPLFSMGHITSNDVIAKVFVLGTKENGLKVKAEGDVMAEAEFRVKHFVDAKEYRKL